MLKENRILQQLDVDGNFIGSGGATTLAELLKENRTLQQLNVGYNYYIGDGRATALTEMLKENRTLKQLKASKDNGAIGTAIMQKQTRLLA